MQIQQEIEALLEHVINKPFKICWCDDPWCQIESRVLHLTDKGTTDYVQQVALHETAHLLLERGGHDVVFWELFTRLVNEHLDTTLNEHQMKMKKDYEMADTTLDYLASYS
jgi:hypothetical protein